MLTLLGRSAAIVLVILLLPSTIFAQAAITGVVKDTSGAVLPGVSVEAASPVLIEKVRSVVTDDTGQYRIVDLRPGTYEVTFTLPGFSTIKREGIELSGSFVATINGELRVGALEETITVTGETPVVDVQSAKVQQTVSRDIISAIPTSRNASGIQSLIPGMTVAQQGVSVGGGDSGGIAGGIGGSAGTIHGGNANSSRTKNDGLNTGFAGGAMGGGQLLNVAGAQEVVVSTSGGMGEAEAGGVTLDIIPRDGSNNFGGSFFTNGARRSMQGNNYTQGLKDQGLKAPSNLISLYDVSPMGGGRIIRDRLWFYLTYRQVASNNTVPGMWVNKNAGNPNAWTVDFDLNRQAFTDALDRNGIARITWQATPRNKINLHWSEQYNSLRTKGGGSATETIESTGRTIFQPSHIQQASWSSPATSRLLLEAGFGTYEGRYTQSGGGGPRVDGTFNPLMIRVIDQGGNVPSCNCQIPGLASRMSAGSTDGGFNHDLLGTYGWRASLSYVSGAHNMKFGYQGGFGNPKKELRYYGEIISIRMNNGVINQLTQTAVYPGGLINLAHSAPINFYAQDQWTTGRLTLQGGIRFDNVLTSSPEATLGGQGYTLLPTPIVFPEAKGYRWHDVTPRMGVAYDLFGNGKTALKFNLGKYMEGWTTTSAQNIDPINLTAFSTTRSWTDSNKNYTPECDLRNTGVNGECGAVANRNFGTDATSKKYDPEFITGWGNRPYNWSLGLSIQQEILPRVSVNVGYFRNSWGNQFVVDNLATALSDYTPFSIAAPSDPRLPGGGGQTVSGLFDLVPGKIGQVNQLAELASNFAVPTENWQGVDVGVTARLRNGMVVQGGTSTGRRLTDSCAIRAALPELGADTLLASSVTNPYCRVVEPYLTSATGLATYTIPKVDTQVSVTWQSNPGPQIAANYVVSNAVIAGGPQPLGRILSGGASNVTVNLIEPGTLYGARRNNLDFRVAKIFRYGRTRTQVGLDIYNLTNTDVVVGFNNTFVPGGAWLTPTQIQPARYFKVSGQFDF